MSIAQPMLALQEEGLAEPAFLERRFDGYFNNPRRDAWPRGEHILVGRRPGPSDIRLQSNDYLALAMHSDVLAAMRRATFTEAGSNSSADAAIMAAVFLHGDCPQARFETSMASLMGSEAAVLMQSGWAANTGLLQAIVEPGTPVYIDMFAHMSLHEGVQIARGNRRPFKHNDTRSLEREIRLHGPGFIVVDSLYSTTGALAPLPEIVRIAERFGCVLIVDEAHSLGTHGPRGAGLVAKLGLSERVHFRTASLAKAFAGRAGIIACSARAAEVVKYQANPAIFSSALMPSEIARLDAIRALIETADDRRARLAERAQQLRHGLRALGYDVGESASHIVALQPGEESRTIVLRNALEARGVFGSVFCAPATPVHGSLLRLTVHSEIGALAIDRVLQACADVRAEVDPESWRARRRLRMRAKPRSVPG